jgi:hypothetical protein
VATGRPALEMARGIQRMHPRIHRDSFYFGSTRWRHIDTIHTLLLISENRLQYAGRISGLTFVDPHHPPHPGATAARISDFNRLRAAAGQAPLNERAFLLDLEPCDVPGVPLHTRHPSNYPFTFGHRFFTDLEAFRRAFLAL